MNGDPCNNTPNGGTTIIEIPRFIPNPDIDNDGVVTMPSQQLPGSLRTVARNNVSHFGEQTDGGIQGAISDQFQQGNEVDIVFIIDGCEF